jgi:hypothetical protein
VYEGLQWLFQPCVRFYEVAEMTDDAQERYQTLCIFRLWPVNDSGADRESFRSRTRPNSRVSFSSIPSNSLSTIPCIVDKQFQVTVHILSNLLRDRYRMRSRHIGLLWTTRTMELKLDSL